MRSFLYRHPRFSTNVRMDFIVRENVLLGVCHSLSESGLRGTFSHPVPARAEGFLTLYHEQERFQVKAAVDSIYEDEARVSFRFETNEERESLRKFMRLLFPDVLNFQS
jgi:hypothetical protein